MDVLKGIPVSPGVCIGEAIILGREEPRVRRRAVPRSRLDAEVSRLDSALRKTVQDLNGEIGRLGDDMVIPRQVLESHAHIIADAHLRDEIVRLIRRQKLNAEYALVDVLRGYYRKFSAVDSQYISERAHDLADIERTILLRLGGKRRSSRKLTSEPRVVVSHNLTPSEAASLDRSKVLGVAVDVGGRTSHVAIMARAMQLPAVVGLQDLVEVVSNGQTVIVDGYSGTVIVDPDEESLEEYRRKATVSKDFYAGLHKEVRLPAETLDGYKLSLAANIEFPEEIPTALEWGATGVGLYRTEFLYSESLEPDEETHYTNYRRAVEELRGRYLVVRTLDAGADKFHTEAIGYHEPNPFLGCRSIRLCFLRPEVFRAQIRAVLRVSAQGPVRIMLPMVSSLEELRRAKQMIREVELELEEKGIEFDQQIPLGIMVEVPSAALIIDLLAREVDFISIGTNDLVQYCLAVDRVNERVAHLYQPTHPSILRLIKSVIETSRSHSVHVSICGEMCSEPLYTILLLGLGLRSFSLSPIAIPTVKRIVRQINMRDAAEVARTCLRHETAEESQEFLETKVLDLLPGMFN